MVFSQACADKELKYFMMTLKKYFQTLFTHYARTEGLSELKPQNGHQSIFSETGPVLQEAVQKGILKSNKKKKKRLQDFFALAPCDKQVDCWLIRARISPESAELS